MFIIKHYYGIKIFLVGVYVGHFLLENYRAFPFPAEKNRLC